MDNDPPTEDLRWITDQTLSTEEWIERMSLRLRERARNAELDVELFGRSEPYICSFGAPAQK